MLGIWPEDHNTSNAVESDVCNSSPHIRTDFAFPWQHLIIVSHFAGEVKQNGSTGKCVEESKDRDSPQCYLTMTSSMLYATRTMFTAWCDVCLYNIIHVTPGYSFKLALVMIQFWFINVLI